MQLPIAQVRFVAVSATIPNIGDIAAWLEVPPAGLLVYGEEMRPVSARGRSRAALLCKLPACWPDNALAAAGSCLCGQR